MQVAHILNNKINQIIEMSEEYFNANKDSYHEGILVDVTNMSVGIGYHYIEGNFYFNLPNNEEQKELRRKAYVTEADPLFFKWQRGEIEQDLYTNKIEEIKNKYIYYYNDEGILDLDLYDKIFNNPDINKPPDN